MSEMQFVKEEEVNQATFATKNLIPEEEAPKEDAVEEAAAEVVDMNNYDVFGNLIVETSAEKRAKKNNATAAPKPPKPEVKADPAKIVGQEYTVFYARARIEVPENNMTIESLRSYLETDYPEMSKERTEMMIDEQKLQIIPVIKSPKKG